MMVENQFYRAPSTSRSLNSLYGAVSLEEQASSLQGKDAQLQPSAMSIPVSIFNLSKVLVGAGMLALPSGMAAGQGTGFVPAILTLLFAATVSAYTFYTIGISLHATNTTSFKDLLLHTLGPRMGYIIDLVIIILGLGLGLLYADFVGDLFSTLLKSFSGIPDWLATRQVVILIITATVLGPLCMQKNLQALRHSSYLGMCAVIYIAIFMVLRHLDGTYFPGGKYWQEDETNLQSQSDIEPWTFGLGSTVLMSMISTAFCAHQNAPQFSSQLKNFTKVRFATVVFSAFCLSSFLYVTVMLTGFWTFGVSCQGLILDNFSESDPLAFVARLATGISVLCSSPLIFAALRESVSNCLESRVNLSFCSLSLILLCLITLLSLFFSDVGFIVSMIGSLVNGPLVFILPSMAYLKVMEMGPDHKRRRMIKIANWFLIYFGYFLSIFVSVISVLNTFTTLLK